MKVSRTFQASLCALGTLAVAISMTACGGSTAAVEPAAGQAAEVQVDEFDAVFASVVAAPIPVRAVTA